MIGELTSGFSDEYYDADEFLSDYEDDELVSDSEYDEIDFENNFNATSYLKDLDSDFETTEEIFG